jgi:hypothetical protein
MTKNGAKPPIPSTASSKVGEGTAEDEDDALREAHCGVTKRLLDVIIAFATRSTVLCNIQDGVEDWTNSRGPRFKAALVSSHRSVPIASRSTLCRESGEITSSFERALA